jgi:non-specific serine/threonine protein kinase
MIGKFIAHYKILEKLGEGGMGVVYKAEDTKLKRTVALKFLPPELTRDLQAKKRFLQEAQAAAALDHPNICTIHEINEVEGRMFIVMTYINGQSLKERIALGPIKVAEALDISTQVAEGLWAAHEKGIIHRDIKPANIMLPEKGPAKIMDFGLAKLVWAADLTKTAGTMGTLAYMSPEQARGDAVDHRTDIWSFGVVMYEMLAGQLPFRGEETQGVVYSILNKDPERLSVLCPDVPRHIEQAVAKALVKDPVRRYQSIQEFLKDLKAPAPFIFPKPEKSIVVLPFEDLSPGKDNEYFSDGLTEEIIADLSQVHDLLVISRSSAMTFKGTKKTIPEIARAVNVRYVLEGSVRKAGNNLRITAQLIDATNDAHLWAEKYNGTLDDVFDIQEKASRSIVDTLRIKLNPEENKKIVERPVSDVHAYECYLRAKKEFWSNSEGAFERALQEINRGINIIGENELFYAAKGSIYFQFIIYGIKEEEYFRKLKECVAEIFTLNSGSYHGYYLLGLINHKEGKIQESVGHLKRVLAKHPNNPESLFWLIFNYAQAGQISAARPLAEKLLDIDPLTPINHCMPGYLYEMEGKFEDGLEYKRKYLQLEPESAFARFCCAQPLLYSGHFEEGFRLIDLVFRDTPEIPWAWLGIFYKYALTGEKTKAKEINILEREETAKKDATYSQIVADCFSLLGEKELALDWLENAAKRGFINYPFLNEYDPFLANIRGEERFRTLMERVKYEWEHFEV